MFFLAFRYENPNLSSYLLAVIALMKSNLLSFILEEFSHIFSAFSIADIIALAAHCNCRYSPTIFARSYPVISKTKD
jgi:hypothetical protein